jgi:hypothetical protein
MNAAMKIPIRISKMAGRFVLRPKLLNDLLSRNLLARYTDVVIVTSSIICKGSRISFEI